MEMNATSTIIPRIQILDAATADQIAAGEVVERPGSVLKELVENSLDAKATEIKIKIAEGGVTLLEVADNGHGIANEDLPLALSRYATSKIRSASEIHHIKSWGFRGEALAAIAAVSRVKISSRISSEDLGREIICEASKIIADSNLSRPVGTTVRMQELFFNTPARRKFLKSQAAENSFCLQILYRLILAAPEVHWEINIDQEKSIIFPAVSSTSERFNQVFQKGLRLTIPETDIIAFHEKYDGITVSGYTLHSKHYINSTRGIFTFVNKRSVKDKLIQQAILTAAKEILFGRSYPQIVLFLELPPELVDVNVHPTKAEVRFSNPDQIFRAIRKTLLNTLQNMRGITNSSVNINAEASANLLQQQFSQQPSLLQTPATFHQKFNLTEQMPTTGQAYTAVQALVAEQFPPQSNLFTSATAATQVNHRNLQFISSLKNTYLLFQEADGLLLVDQHAAHERVTYEKIRAQTFQGTIPSNALLVPIMIEVSETGLALLQTEFAALQKLGLYLEQTSPTQIRVLEIPTLLLNKEGAPKVSLYKVIQDLIQNLEHEDHAIYVNDLFKKILLDTLATESCHGSVRAGQALSAPEAYALVDQMQATDFAGHCPHGRPTTIRLSWTDLEKMFKRIV